MREEAEPERAHAAASRKAASAVAAPAVPGESAARPRADASHGGAGRARRTAWSERCEAAPRRRPARTKMPPPSSSSGSGLAVVATTGVPQAAASTAGSPNPSQADGRTQRHGAAVQVAQLLVGDEAGPVHQRIGPCLRDGAANRRLIAVEDVPVDRAHQQEVRGAGAGLLDQRRVRPDHGIHVLVGVEAADVDEPARTGRQSGAGAAACDILCGESDGPECGSGASPATRIRSGAT